MGRSKEEIEDQLGRLRERRAQIVADIDDEQLDLDTYKGDIDFAMSRPAPFAGLAAELGLPEPDRRAELDDCLDLDELRGNIRRLREELSEVDKEIAVLEQELRTLA